MGVVIFIVTIVLFAVVGFFAFLLIMQDRAVKAGNKEARLFDFLRQKKGAQTKKPDVVLPPDTNENEDR